MAEEHNKISHEGSPRDDSPKNGLDSMEKQSTNRTRGDWEDPFGDETNAEVKYKTLSWWKCGIVMIAETIALGILSLPSTLATLGLVPGIILIIGLGLVATYTGYVLGQFKLAYPHVHNMGDAGGVLLGPIGREVFTFAQIIFLIFLMGSHVLTFSIMMNTVTEHGTCTVVFMIVGMVVSIICTIPRTLQKVSYLCIASFISIFAAVLITMVGIGVEKPSNHVDATTSPKFYNAFLSVTNIIFAYAGHANFFSFISEMAVPTEYPKALYLLQFADISMYTIAAVVIYRFGGPDVSSPALGSTGPMVRKVAYGIAIPTIVIAGVINGHVAAKMIYVRLFRGTNRMQSRSLFSTGVWLGIICLLWVISWIIAEAIPVFNNLLGLITSLFCSWFTYGLSGIFWLFLNWGQWTKSARSIALTTVNILVFGLGAAICGLGLYASGRSISEDNSTAVFSCGDNA